MTSVFKGKGYYSPQWLVVLLVSVWLGCFSGMGMAAGNQPPKADGQTVSTNEDTKKSIPLKGKDPEKKKLSYAIVSQPAHGTVTLKGSAATYMPAKDYFSPEGKPDSFTFKVNDGQLDSEPAQVVVTVKGINDAPVAQAGSAAAVKDTARDITLLGTDVEGDALAYTPAKTSKKGGTLKLKAGNVVTYTPKKGFVGTDSFTFTVADNKKAKSKAATVTVNVNSSNTPPLANAGEDQQVVAGDNVTLDGSNSTDLDGNIVSYAWVQTAGTGVVLSNTSVAKPTFSAPDVAASELLKFELTVKDNNGATSIGQVSINVGQGGNKKPLKVSGIIWSKGTGGQVVLKDSAGKEVSSVPVSDDGTYLFEQKLADDQTYTVSYQYDAADLVCVFKAAGDQSVCNLNPLSSVKALVYEKLDKDVDKAEAEVRNYFRYFEDVPLNEFNYEASVIAKNIEGLSSSLQKEIVTLVDIIADDVVSHEMEFCQSLQQTISLDAVGNNELEVGNVASVYLSGINKLSGDYTLVWSGLPDNAKTSNDFAYAFSSNDSTVVDVTATIIDKSDVILLELKQPVYFYQAKIPVAVVPEDVSKPVSVHVSDNVVITVPENTLAVGEQITFTEVENPNPSQLKEFVLEPAGKVFAQPLTLEYAYDPNIISDPRQLRVIRQSGHEQSVLSISSVDYDKHTISFKTEHFSNFIIDYGIEYGKEKLGIDYIEFLFENDSKILKWEGMQSLLNDSAKILYDEKRIDHSAYLDLLADIKNPDKKDVSAIWSATLNHKIIGEYSYWGFIKDNYPFYCAYELFSDEERFIDFDPAYGVGRKTIDVMNIYAYLYANSNIGGKSPQAYGVIENVFRINNVFYSKEFSDLNLSYDVRALEKFKAKAAKDLLGILTGKIPGLSEAMNIADKISFAGERFAGFFNYYTTNTAAISSTEDYLSFMAFGSVDGYYKLKLDGQRDFIISSCKNNGDCKEYRYSNGEVVFDYMIENMPVSITENIAYINLGYSGSPFYQMYKVLSNRIFDNVSSSNKKSRNARIIDFYFAMSGMLNDLMESDRDAGNMTLRLKPKVLDAVSNPLLKEGKLAPQKIKALLIKYLQFKGVTVKTLDEIKKEKIMKHLKRLSSNPKVKTVNKVSARADNMMSVTQATTPVDKVILELPTLTTLDPFLNVGIKVSADKFADFTPERVEIVGEKSAISLLKGNASTTADVLDISDDVSTYTYVKPLDKTAFKLNSDVYGVTLRDLFAIELPVAAFDNTYNNIKVRFYYTYVGKPRLEEKDYEFSVSQFSYEYKDYVLRVRVRDKTSQLPIIGATVNLNLGQQAAAITDSNGEAVFSKVVPNNYNISAKKDGYQYGEGALLISDGGDAEYTKEILLEKNSEDNGDVSLNGIVTGKVTFLDNQNQMLNIPTDAWVRITPSRFQNDASGWHALQCKIGSDGVFGNSDCYTQGETANLKQALADNAETFQIVVYKDHIQKNGHRWNCGEDVYKYVDGNASIGAWGDIVVSPSDYQDRSGENCGNNGATGKLNDTGITTCSNDTQNNLPCPQTGFPGQDAESGRDANQATNNDTDGYRGFSFTKISSTGLELPASATEWSCVKDNVTGLMWEVKTDDGGLHDKDWAYTWYEPDETKNGGYAGIQNGGFGFCNYTKQCDTYGYVQAVNATGWCGYKDWRIPTKQELRTLVIYDRSSPLIETAYFPNTNSWSWSSSPVANDNNKAWGFNFNVGESDAWHNKDNQSDVRLVRNGR